jgi:hypothetical protein
MVVTISVDYSHPVQVNGFTCHNCAEVDLAKKHIDPAHPKSGPYDVDAASDPSRTQAVILGGALAKADPGGGGAPRTYQPGQTLNVTV